MEPLRIATVLTVSCPVSTLRFLVTNEVKHFFLMVKSHDKFINPFRALESETGFYADTVKSTLDLVISCDG